MGRNFLNVLREFGQKGENVGYIGAEQAAQVSPRLPHTDRHETPVPDQIVGPAKQRRES